MARFQETVNLQPQSFATGGAEAQQNLAQRLEGFKNRSLQVAQQQAIQRGVESAADVPIQTTDVNGKQVSVKPQEKEKRFIGGIESTAYNKAMGSAYVSSLNNDNRENMAAIATANQFDVAKYDAAAEGYASGVLKTVDPAIRALVAADLDDRITSGRIKIQNQTAIRDYKAADALNAQNSDSALIAAGNFAFEGDMESAAREREQGLASIEARVEANAITASEGQELGRKFDLEIVEQINKGEVSVIAQREGFAAAFAEIDRRSKEAPKNVSRDEWDSIMGQTRADINHLKTTAAQVELENSVATDRAISNLNIAVNTGIDPTTGEPAPEPSVMIKAASDFFEAGQISGQERTSLVTRIIDQDLKAQEKAARMKTVSDRLAGMLGQPISTPDANEFYTEFYLPIIAQATPEQANALNADFVDKTKVVPSALISQVDANIASGDIELISLGADMMSKLDDVPGITEPFSPTNRAMGTWVDRLSKTMEPAEASKLARELTDPRNKARIDARQEEFKELQTGFNSESFDIDDVIERGIFNFNVPPSEVNKGIMQKQYKDQVEAHFLAGMDLSTAKKKADQLVKRNWKNQFFLGRNEAFQYPLIDYYPVEGSISYLDKQLMTHVQNDLAAGESIGRDDVFLLSDNRTAEEAAFGRPTYLIYFTKDGQIVSSGFRFAPDSAKELERRDAELNAKRDQVSADKRESIQQRFEAGGFGSL